MQWLRLTEFNVYSTGTNKQTNKQSLCAAVKIMHVLFGCLPFTFAGESKEEEKFLAL